MSSRRKSLSIAWPMAMVAGLCWLALSLALAQQAPSLEPLGQATSPEVPPPPAPPGRAETAPAAPAPLVLREPEPEPEPAAHEVGLSGVPGGRGPEVIDGVIAAWPIQDTPIRTVLRGIADLSQKSIVPSRNVQGNVSADLYNVTLREAMDALLRTNGFDYVEEGNFIFIYTDKELSDIRRSRRQTSVQVFPLYYVRPEDVVALIAPALSADATLAITPSPEQGISTSATDAGGLNYATDDMLVVRDYEENLANVAEILQRVDRRPQQVLIEATIVRATLNENNALGIDFNTLAGVDFRQLNASTAGLTNLSTPQVPVNALDNKQATFRTDFNSTIGPGGFSFGYIGSDIAVFLRALEGVTDSQVLANPKLLVVNKQRGEVLVGRRDGYLTTTVTQTTATQTVAFLETGTRLVMRPYIGENGYIRMEIHPEDSSGTVSNGLPTQQTTEATSNVLVKDGHTIVIGGLFRETTTAGRNQIPVLGNIPYAGVAFRSTSDFTQREEVIILITPHIIRHAPDEAVSAQLKEDVERFRMGMRQNLAWFGRGRLAASHLRWAKEHLANGRQDKAMWDLNMALNMSPQMHEALLLKERLTNEATWAHEPRHSSVHWVVERMIMQDLGLDPGMVMLPCRPTDAAALPADVREAFGLQPQLHDVLDWVPCPPPAGTLKAQVCPPEMAPATPVLIAPGLPEEPAVTEESSDVPEATEAP